MLQVLLAIAGLDVLDAFEDEIEIRQREGHERPSLTDFFLQQGLEAYLSESWT